MKTDMDYIAEQCEAIDRIEGHERTIGELGPVTANMEDAAVLRCSDVDAAWQNDTPVWRIIVHFAARCRAAAMEGNKVEATRCAEIGGAVEDAVREYQNAIGKERENEHAET